MPQLLNIDIDPRKFRRLYLAFLLAGLALIWAVYAAGQHFIERSEEQAFRAQMGTDTVVLEDHASRTLDTVAARLKAVSTLTDAEALHTARLGSRALHEMIFADAVVRSVSLVDDGMRVIASSNVANIGIALPPDVLPDRADTPGIGEVRFGKVFPSRDLAGAGRPSGESGVHMWLASSAVLIEGRLYQWVAVINPGFFENFWARAGNDASMEMALFDYRGQRIVAHQTEIPSSLPLTKTLLENVDSRGSGQFDLGARREWIVSYRGSANHPVIFAIIAPRQAAQPAQSGDKTMLFALALLATVALFVVTGVLYRWYLRYERSITEMANQARAIGAHLMVSESDPAGNIICVNPAFQEFCGYSEKELVGKNHRIFNSGFHPVEVYRQLWETVSAGGIWKGTFRNLHKSGRYCWVNATIVPFLDPWGRVSRYVCFYSDITEAISLSEKIDAERRLREELSTINRELAANVNTDPLTGVANRRGFTHFAAQAIAMGRQFGQPISLLMLDLDRFKTVNDTYGHAAGDEVLKEIVQRWIPLVRASDMLARLGGEEFCVLLPNATTAQARRVADNILEATAARPVAVSRGDGVVALNITVSIGLAGVEHYQTLDISQLLQTADEALYEAKRAGRNRIVTQMVELDVSYEI